MEHFGVEADLMTVAKSIAGGLPLSGVLGRAEIMNRVPDSAIGGTFPAIGSPAQPRSPFSTRSRRRLVERAAQRSGCGWSSGAAS